MIHDDDVTSVAFSPDGKYVVSGSDDNTARVWEAGTGKEIARMTHDGIGVPLSPSARTENMWFPEVVTILPACGRQALGKKLPA